MRKFLAIIGGLTLLVSSVSLPLAASAATTYTLFGDATVVAGGNPGNAAQLRSSTSVSPGYGGVEVDPAAPIPWSSLTALSTDYNVTDDNCGGGSPRITVGIDTNNDTVADGFVHIAIGPSPSFTGCATGWQSTGNLIGNNDAGRYDFSQFGGSPFTTYSAAPVAVTAGNVTEVDIVVDGSWNSSASGGDSEQTVLVDNITVNQDVTTFEPAPVKVTIIKYVNGQPATATGTNSTLFPMHAVFPGGEGDYALGPNGFNNPNSYQATTADMPSGSNYGTYETAAPCTPNYPYMLDGYSTGDTEAAALAAPTSTTTPSFTNLTSDKYVIVRNKSCDVHVTIIKYVDGQHATASSTNSSTFPFTATYNASNIGAGSDPFTIGPVGNGTPNPYEAKTITLASGADYSASENTTGNNVVGATCQDGKPFALVGYSSGNTLAEAQSATTTPTAPAFTGLTTDKFVIAKNQSCQAAPTMLKVHILKYLDGHKATSTPGNYQFPMSATWQTANLNGGATTTGAYVLGNNHGGAPDQFGADTAPMQSPAYYTTNEITGGNSNVLPSGSQCQAGKYVLQGYSTSSISFADAVTQPMSTSTPTFTVLTSDRYVVVWNTSCQTPAPPSATACSSNQAPAGYTLQNGTIGNDNVTLAPNTMFVGKGGKDIVKGGDGNYIICTGSGNDTITLGNGNVTINAGAGNNTVTVGSGSGTIDTGANNDVITVGDGPHTINAGAGSNTVTTGNGDQMVSAGGGNDKITTGNGNDTINAGAGNNTVYANGGNDSITAGGGNDYIDGGPGTDTCNPGGGINTVLNCP